MGSLNKAMVLGNLGRDAELRYTPGGAAVATLSLATTETWNDKAGQRQERTEWHRIVVWGKQAESLAEYLKKGKQILVEGRIQTRQWTDRENAKRFTTEIRADRITLLGGGNGAPGGRRERAATAAAPVEHEYDPQAAESDPGLPESGAEQAAPPDDSDIPF
jgi:single-strand DNA-binding protein